MSDETKEQFVPDEPVDDQLDQASDAEEYDSPRRRGFPIVIILLLVIVLLLTGTAVAGYYVIQAQQAAKVPQTLQDVVVRQLKAQIAQTPRNGVLYLQLAGSYYTMKDYSGASKALADLRSINPTGALLAESMYAAGKIAEAQGKPDAAVTSYKQSLGVTETADARYALGVLSLNRKQYGDAIANLSRYVNFVSGDADAMQKLAAAYEGAGNKAKALEWYQEALKFTVNDAKILAAIKRLKGQ